MSLGVTDDDIELINRGDPFSRSRRRRPSAASIGAGGAVLLFIGIALAFALSQPPFAPPDETAHLAYAHHIADFELPRITDAADAPDSAVQWQAELESQPDDRYRSTWVANHPPAFYVLTAPLIWLSDATHRSDGGLLFLRLANITFAAVGVGLTYLLARDLSGGNRRIGAAAAAIAALVPQGHAIFSEGMNDGLAFAAGTAVAWAAVRCVGTGAGRCTRRNLALLGAASVMCAGARSATLLVAVVAVGWVAAIRFHRHGGSFMHRVRAAAFVGLVGLGPAAVVFGWFYVRNWSLYGDFAGSDFLMDRFEREPRGSILEILSWGHMWSDLYHKLMSPSSTFGVPAPPGVNPLLLLAAVGVLAAAVVGRTGDVTGSHSGPTIRRSALALCVTIVLVVVVTVAQHVSNGGSRYARYLLPALGVGAALVAIGLDRLVRRALVAATIVLMAWWALRNVPSGVDPTAVRRDRDHGSPMPDVLQVLPGRPWMHTAAVVVIVGGCVAVATSLALDLLGRQRPTGRTATRRRGDSFVDDLGLGAGSVLHVRPDQADPEGQVGTFSRSGLSTRRGCHSRRPP
jgi:hypothetical protein